MKLRIILYILLWLTSYNSWSQTYIVQVKNKLSENWKYANLKGEIIIEKKFPVSLEFSEDGVALIYYPKKNQYFIINIRGEVIETEYPIFEYKEPFRNESGFADGLLIDYSWGAYNKEGKLAIAAKYDNLSGFNNGYAIGRITNQFYVVDKTGKEIVINEPGIRDVKHFSENLAPFTSETGGKGYIDTNGKIAIPAQFTNVGYFSSGLAWAKIVDNVGFIGTDGKWVINPDFKSASEFDAVSGLARVKYDNEVAFIKKTGEIVTFNNLGKYSYFREGLAIGKKEMYYGFCNNNGEWVINPIFEDLHNFRNGFAAARKNYLWGIIDNKGNWILKPTFKSIRDVIVIGSNYTN